MELHLSDVCTLYMSLSDFRLMISNIFLLDLLMCVVTRSKSLHCHPPIIRHLKYLYIFHKVNVDNIITNDFYIDLITITSKIKSINYNIYMYATN